ncbi:MAG: toast rack family protein [Anaerolineales bacterium]
MRPSFLAVLATLAGATLACSGLTFSVQQVQTGPTQTLTINEPLPASGQAASVTFELGSGSLHLSAGASGLAEGNIRYNVADWAPQVQRSGSNLTIRQQTSTSTFALEGPQVVNDWDFRLGPVPMNLTIEAGAYHGNLDLTGLFLRNLSISDGASQSEVNFGQPNPETMQLFSFRTGASTATLRGLANANFQEMTFDGGAGDFTLDFGGELRHSATLRLRTGVSSVRLVVPTGLNVLVTTQSGPSSVQTDAGWRASGSTYRHGGTGPLLSITIEMGLGSLSLLSD